MCHQPGRFIHDGSLMELAISQQLACVKKEIVFGLKVLDSQWFHVSSDYLDPGCSKGSTSKELERLQHILGPLGMSDPLLTGQVIVLASSPYRNCSLLQLAALSGETNTWHWCIHRLHERHLIAGAALEGRRERRAEEKLGGCDERASACLVSKVKKRAVTVLYSPE